MPRHQNMFIGKQLSNGSMYLCRSNNNSSTHLFLTPWTMKSSIINIVAESLVDQAPIYMNGLHTSYNLIKNTSMSSWFLVEMLCSISPVLVGFPSSTFPSKGPGILLGIVASSSTMLTLDVLQIGNHIYIWGPRVMNWGWLSTIKS